MRASVLAGVGLTAALALPAAAAGTPGPFAGVVTQGQTKTHLYDNNPSNNPCLHIMATYTVTLAYAPASDVLTLSVGAATATGSNGVASLSLARSQCTSFTVAVSGTSVGDAAAYAVTVTRQNTGSLG